MIRRTILLIGIVLFGVGCVDRVSSVTSVPTQAPTPTELPPTLTDDFTCVVCAEDYVTTQVIIDSGMEDTVFIRWMPNYTELIIVKTNQNSSGTSVEFYDPIEWKMTRSLSVMGIARAVDVSIDGRRLLISHQVINVETGDVLITFEYPNEPVAFSPNGQWLFGLGWAEGSPTDRFIVWDAQTGEQHADLGLVNMLDASFIVPPDGKSIAIFDVNGDWTQWDLTTGNYIGLFAEFANKDFWEEAWTYSPDGTLLAVGGFGRQTPNAINIFDVSTRAIELTIEPKLVDSIDRLIYSPNGKVLALQTFKWQNAVQVLDAKTGRLLKHLSLRSFRAVHFTPDSKSLIWLGDDGKVRQWPLPTEP